MRKDTGVIPASSKIVLDNTPPEKGAKVHTVWLAKKKVGLVANVFVGALGPFLGPCGSQG